MCNHLKMQWRLRDESAGRVFELQARYTSSIFSTNVKDIRVQQSVPVFPSTMEAEKRKFLNLLAFQSSQIGWLQSETPSGKRNKNMAENN